MIKELDPVPGRAEASVPPWDVETGGALPSHALRRVPLPVIPPFLTETSLTL